MKDAEMQKLSARSLFVGLALLLACPTQIWAQDGDAEDVLIDVDEAEAKKKGETPAPAPTGAPVVAPEVTAAAPTVQPTADNPLSVKVRSSTGIYQMENRDFRTLDESSDRAIIDSDDRRLFGHTDVAAEIGYRVRGDLRFDAELKYDVLWRDDQLGRAAGSTGDLNIYRLNVTYDLLKTEGFDLQLTMGRQPFSIGGVERDYVLAGTSDSIVAKADFGSAGAIRVLAIDFFGGNSLPQNGYQFYRDGRETSYNLRGETNTLRSGAVYELDAAGLAARAYYFYATIGGGPVEESGADITYGGALGNFRDRDYQHLAGGRLAYTHEMGRSALAAFGEFAHSEGLDRKAPTDRDVVTAGNAYGGGLTYTHDSPGLGIHLGGSFYHFDGSLYGSDGLEYERGFVSFKGSRIGGLALARHAGWRPASHVDSAGVVYAPQDQARVSGTEFINADFGIRLGKTELKLAYWLLTDTSSSFLDIPGLDNLTPEPPFGHTRAEFEAQERYGLGLGTALDFELIHNFNEAFGLVLSYGQFTPGEFYAIEVDKVAGDQRTALGGQEVFWVGHFGSRVQF